MDGLIGSGLMSGNQMMPKSMNVLLGFIVMAVGAFLLLQQFKVIPVFVVPNIILNVVMLVAGVILLLDGIGGAKNASY
jgi:hypothetical protein